MRQFIIVCSLLVISMFQPVAAASIEGLQLPVWMQRDGVRTAAKPGMQLQQGDRLETGRSGKLVIRTDDGSVVKLGVDAQFTLDRLEPAADTDSIFSGAWRLLRGAFRFTTTALGADRKRNIDISVGTATIGIRGTDVWGRASDDEDLVCLLEGKIEITRGDEQPVPMSEPLSVYTAARSGVANPLSSVDLPTVQKLGAETELDEGRGVLRKDGRYSAYLLSTQKQDYAEQMRAQYTEAGYPAEVSVHTVNDAEWYRVGVAGFISAKDAQAFAKSMEGVLGTRGAWIKKAL